jgi:hypothetical protein
MMQFFTALIYTLLGSALAAAGELSQPHGELGLDDAWDVVHMSIGAVFGALCHTVSVNVVGARVLERKKLWRISAGAIAGILAVAGVRSQNHDAALSLELLIVGPLAWLGSQAIEALSREFLLAILEAIKRWGKKLFE